LPGRKSNQKGLFSFFLAIRSISYMTYIMHISLSLHPALGQIVCSGCRTRPTFHVGGVMARNLYFLNIYYRYLSSRRHFTLPRTNVSGVPFSFAVAMVNDHVFSILMCSRIIYTSSPTLTFLVNSLSSPRYIIFILFSKKSLKVKGILSGLFLIYTPNTTYAACFIASPN
jgi:hypothetical protein